MDFGEGGVCSQVLLSAEGYHSSQKASVSIKDFSAFLDVRRCKTLAHKISRKYLSEDLSAHFFPRAQGASFLISTLNSFQEMSKVRGCHSL